MINARKTLLVLLTSLLAFAPLAVQAEDPGSISEMWTMVPKADQREAFFEGLKEHMQVRAEAGDPWNWNTYTPMLGDKLDIVGVRYCCFNWEDKDAYSEWSEKNPEVQEHWAKAVGVHVESYGHYFNRTSWVNSNISGDWGPYRFFRVTEFTVKAGMGSEFDAARDEISQVALNQGWSGEERPWIWTSGIGGSGSESIIVPMKNYADMEPKGQTFFNFLSGVLGSDAKAEKLLQKLSGTVASQETQIWELHKDLSMGD